MGTCFHCGEPIAQDVALYATVAGRTHPVCCIGCRAAAEWIASLGLSDYYRLRDTTAARATAVGDFRAWDRAPLQRLYVHTRTDGSAEAVLLIEGVRCAACSWLLEHALSALDGVREVGVNVAGKRLRVVWEPQRIALSALLEAIARLGYTPHPLDARALDDVATREQRIALKRLAVAGLGMMQAMMFAIVLYAGALEGIDAPTRDFFRWIGVVVTLPVVFYAALPFFRGAAREWRGRAFGMDTPVALAVALVFVASVVETVRGGAQVYFDSAGMFVFLLLGGRYLEMRARHRAADVVDALARLQPAVAQRRRADGALESVGVHELERGDCIVVADGATVPADGELLDAECRVDEALLSGESKALLRRRGDALIAGSVVCEGPAELRVERIGADTTLATIVRLADHAQQRRPHWTRYGERAAAWFVAGQLLATVATALAWLAVDPSRAFPAALAVLVVACPCAFALAVPASLARAFAVLTQHGVLALQPDAIERLVRADYFAFDKTGTLTDRALELATARPLAQRTAAECVALAAALEAGSSHPIARAFRQAAAAACVPRAENLRCVASAGVEGDIADMHYRLGRASFALGVTHADNDDIVLADAHGPVARFTLRETLRSDAARTVAALQAQHAAVEVLSGDAAQRVADIAARVHPDHWRARQTPQQKFDRLHALRAQGHVVAVVGDGVNDAPALAGADLAIALGSGADLAQSHADIVLASDRLSTLVDARRIAARTLRVMRQNILWALAYNATSIPLAAMGWISPWLAAIGMSVSSLAVVLNSLRIGAHAARTRTDEAHVTLAPAETAA